jgi:hypothetical protein
LLQCLEPVPEPAPRYNHNNCCPYRSRQNDQKEKCVTLLAYWSMAWVVGIWLASLRTFPLYLWAGGALVASVAAGLSRTPKTRLLLSCAAALILGGTRLVLAQPQFDDHSLGEIAEWVARPRYWPAGGVNNNRSPPSILECEGSSRPEPRQVFRTHSRSDKRSRRAQSGMFSSSIVIGERCPVSSSQSLQLEAMGCRRQKQTDDPAAT